MEVLTLILIASGLLLVYIVAQTTYLYALKRYWSDGAFVTLSILIALDGLGGLIFGKPTEIGLYFFGYLVIAFGGGLLIGYSWSIIRKTARFLTVVL